MQVLFVRVLFLGSLFLLIHETLVGCFVDSIGEGRRESVHVLRSLFTSVAESIFEKKCSICCMDLECAFNSPTYASLCAITYLLGKIVQQASLCRSTYLLGTI